MQILPEPLQFEWDDGNRQKNWMKHKVTDEECEEVFFDPHKRIFKEAVHAGSEWRYVLLGRTSLERALFIVFTIRQKKIRIISARDLNRKERGLS
jgi:hypothetical protein